MSAFVRRAQSATPRSNRATPIPGPLLVAETQRMGDTSPPPRPPNDPTPDPATVVPFFAPPYGRPPESATPDQSEGVPRQLDTPLARQNLNRIGGQMSIAKRMLDIVGALTIALLASPVLIAVALAIKLTDGGPVLFWQKRVGLRGKEFPFPKFRSMVANADRLVKMLETRNDHAKTAQPTKRRSGVITFKMKDDPRITWIGRIIRKLSIDEVPQLWCVLRGEMSLVGPRPSLPREVARYSLHARRRLEVTPGLTCIWQVSGRGDIPFPQQVAMDIEYIEKQSLWFDIKLILLTIPAVLKGKGAY